MLDTGSTYRHYMPGLDLFIERYTSRVPSDGKFHLIYKGNIIDSFRSQKQAEEKFYQLVKERGYKTETPKTKRVDPSEDAVERYFQSKAIFWTEGPIRRDKKGKGGRGGV